MDPLDYPMPAMPAVPPDIPVPRRDRDPLAVAFGNASLLGAGYLMLGRRRTAVLADLVTLVLLIILGTGVREVWFEVLVLVWWALMIGHGWFAAGGRARRRRLDRDLLGGWQREPVRRQRLVALAVLLPVLLVVGLLRYDAYTIEKSVNDARRSGDCAQAVRSQHGVWFGPRLANSPGTAAGEPTVAACKRLDVAKAHLDQGLSGDSRELAAGFDGMSGVLDDLPGHEKMVDVVLGSFLGRLPTKDACQTVQVTDWLRARKAGGNLLDRAADVVPKAAPAALVGCADHYMSAQDWKPALTRYQQLLDQYPNYADAGKAKTGARKATLSIQLDNVTELLDSPSDEEADYCTKPAPYGGAPAYGKNAPAMFFGNDDYTDKLPGSWTSSDVAHTAAVVCAGDDEDGTSVQTCPYEGTGIFKDFPTDVTFHKIAIPVKVYSLRTGKLVAGKKIQISGTSCPATLHYTDYSGLVDAGPPSDVYVKASTADIRSAFAPLLHR